MPQIKVIVIADIPNNAVMLSERVNLEDFSSEHFRLQLAERLAWAVGDAKAVEQTNGRDGAV